MKLIIFVVMGISALAFCFCPISGFAQMGDTVIFRSGYLPPSEKNIPYDPANRWTRGSANHNPASEYQDIFGVDFQMGSFVLGVGGKYFVDNPWRQWGELNVGSAMVIGNIGFRF